MHHILLKKKFHTNDIYLFITLRIYALCYGFMLLSVFTSNRDDYFNFYKTKIFDEIRKKHSNGTFIFALNLEQVIDK